jgi:hypothetical protein
MTIKWCVVVALGAAACGGGDGPNFAADHPRIYLARNRDRLTAELNSGRPAAKRLKDATDRWVGGADIYGFAAANAALLGQLTGDAKYCAAAVKDVDKRVTAAQQQIASGAAPDVASDDYLGVGDEIGDIMLVYDWCFASIDGDRKAAWLAYADQAVWNVWNYMDAKWGSNKHAWVGWAVDDPSDNYYYSFLRATMMVGLAAHDEIPQAAGWLTEFHDTKILGELVPTFDADLVGGGSREGTGYGVSMHALFNLYDFWAGSTGEVIATKTGHTRASMLSFIHQTMPTLDRIAPTGDQSRDSTASLFDYHRDYLLELMNLFPKDPLAARGQALLAASTLPQMDNQFMFIYDFLYDQKDLAPTALDGLGTAYYAKGIGEVYARSGWDKHATWVNLIAGSYTQSHAHQDQGALMIYKDSWLAYDSNVDSKSGLNQQIDAHSTVRIVDGGKTVEQQRDTNAAIVALHRGTGYVYAAAELTPAYKPARNPSAAVTTVQREIVYLEPDAIVVYDRVATKAGGQQVWQLVSPASPAITATHATFTVGARKLEVERVIAPGGTTAAAYDFRKEADFTGGFRLDETAPAGDNRFLHVIWIDSAASAVTATTDGATFTLAGGKAVSVTFNHAAIGATLNLGGQAITLGAGVDALPE